MIDSSTCPRLQRFRTSSGPNEAFFSRCHRSVKIYLASSYDVEQKLWITAVTPPLLYPLLPHHRPKIIIITITASSWSTSSSTSSPISYQHQQQKLWITAVMYPLLYPLLPPSQPMLWLRKIVYIFPSICFSSQCLLQVLKSFQWFLPIEKHLRLNNCKLAKNMGDN